MRQMLGGRALVALSALLAVGALACGGDGDGSADGSADGGSGESGAGLSSSGADGEGQGGSDDGGGDDESEVAVVINDPQATVEARDNTFDAETIQVAPGTLVMWTNRGRQDHDIVPAEGSDWGVPPEDFPPNALYQHTFDEPGTYRYYCSLHGTAEAGMTGTVIVAE
jgi:plastocyanin